MKEDQIILGKYNRKVIDLTGKTFGKLVVKEYLGSSKWLCECQCDNRGDKIVSTGHLNSGSVIRCGKCPTKPRHGKKKIAEYNIWADMKRRCYNSKRKSYKDYGGRGITVCERWLESFENFLEDMGPRPSDKHSIDRKNVNGNYEKDNYEWATNKTQSNNTTRNRLLTVNGETKNLGQWSEITGICRETLADRLVRGWSDEKNRINSSNSYLSLGERVVGYLSTVYISRTDALFEIRKHLEKCTDDELSGVLLGMFSEKTYNNYCVVDVYPEGEDYKRYYIEDE